jgi:hypothetical protein
MNKTTSFLAASATAGLLLEGPLLPAVSAEEQLATPVQPLSGQRYQTLCALARYLDETAQGALEGAADDVRRGASTEVRFLPAIRSFARGAGDFRRRVDGHLSSPLEAPPQVADLSERARVMSDRLRAAQALQSTYDEWDAIVDVLRRMARLLDGHAVEVPTPFRVPALSGTALEQFRELAHALEASATRAHSKASREVGVYPARGRQFLAELHYFAAQSENLRRRVDAGDLEPQKIGPMVDHLREEARQADRRMRDAQVFSQVWDDSSRTIDILQRMANLVRS